MCRCWVHGLGIRVLFSREHASTVSAQAQEPGALRLADAYSDHTGKVRVRGDQIFSYESFCNQQEALPSQQPVWILKGLLHRPWQGAFAGPSHWPVLESLVQLATAEPDGMLQYVILGLYMGLWKIQWKLLFRVEGSGSRAPWSIWEGLVGTMPAAFSRALTMLPLVQPQRVVHCTPCMRLCRRAAN